MPTGTFFRLSEEKKQRLMDAAWAEFTTTRFAEVSINQIIRAAQIPRGSFYQYFEDKEELFLYLLETLREDFTRKLIQFLDHNHGDLFAVPTQAFDQLLQQKESPDPALKRFIQVLKVNEGMDGRQFLSEKPELLPQQLRDRIDTSAFRQQDKAFLDSVFFLVVASMVCSLMETAQAPEDWRAHRANLVTRMEIIKAGCLAAVPAEAAT